MTKVIEFLNKVNVSISIESVPSVVKKMIVSMAEPQPNNKKHESGAGYVDSTVFYYYIGLGLNPLHNFDGNTGLSASDLKEWVIDIFTVQVGT